tara:strand:- start:213 stop:500 length:288 start_codon:yes stop_codon:yes gene_type:complete
MVSGVLVVVFPKEEEDGLCSSNANSFCACTPILVASKRIKRNNSEDETTAKNVIVRAFILRIVVVILSLLNNVRVIFDCGSLEKKVLVVLKPYIR